MRWTDLLELFFCNMVLMARAEQREDAIKLKAHCELRCYITGTFNCWFSIKQTQLPLNFGMTLSLFLRGFKSGNFFFRCP